MRKLLIHTLFWAGFFFAWNRIVYFYIDNPVNRLYFTSLDVSLTIIAFYIVFGYLMPFYLKRKQIWVFVLSLVILAIALSCLYSFVMWFILRNNIVPIHFQVYWKYNDLQYNRFFIALLGILGGGISKLAIDRVQSSKRIEQMEKEKSVAELVYLKAQLNPHFLFNSLNNLYAQLEAGSTESKNTLATLAELLRFQLYECDADHIPVYKEVEYLNNYFKMQSIRKENCTIEFLSEDVPAKLEIAPLLLIPFVENAFKYVSDNDGSSNFINSRLKFQDGLLHFQCSNSITPQKLNGDETQSKGIGLNNVLKRLELIYRDKYTLYTDLKDNTYEVDLKIQLK